MKKEQFTVKELKALYKLVKEQEEHAPSSERETYNNYYDEYKESIPKKVFTSIIKKIAVSLPAKDTEQITKDFLRRKYHTFHNYVDEKVYSKLKNAWGQLKTVEIEYFNMDTAEFTKRMLDVYYASSRYTIGYCHLRKAIRKFRTSRIRSANITERSYNLPSNFNKTQY